MYYTILREREAQTIDDIIKIIACQIEVSLETFPYPLDSSVYIYPESSGPVVPQR